MNELQQLVELSQFAGQRFDWVQAGGGNTSLKATDEQLWVKRSGISLADVSEENGLVSLRQECLKNGLLKLVTATDLSRELLDREALAVLEKAGQVGNIARPSIESFLHVLGPKFILHSHPIGVNVLCSRDDWMSVLRPLFPHAYLVPYATPGILLARELLKVWPDAAHDSKPVMAFLQNHGLIVGADSAETVICETERVCREISRLAPLDLSSFSATTCISKLLAQVAPGPWFSRYCSDSLIEQAFQKDEGAIFCPHFCPDQVVYLGGPPLKLKDLHDTEPFKAYLRDFRGYPRVVILDDGLAGSKPSLYLVARRLAKTHDVEALLRFQVLVQQGRVNPIQPLSSSEIRFLQSWESEKYRQKV